MTSYEYERIQTQLQCLKESKKASLHSLSLHRAGCDADITTQHKYTGYTDQVLYM